MAVSLGEGYARDAVEGKGPRRWPEAARPLEEVAKAVVGGYCRLPMPLRVELAVRGTVAGHRLGATGPQKVRCGPAT